MDIGRQHIVGRPTRGAALAVISQARLLAASELWNGNPRFKDFKNKDGELLAPQTKDQEKWRIAAEAAEDVIDLGIYHLYHNTESGDREFDPYLSFRELFMSGNHAEVIFATHKSGDWQWGYDKRCNPKNGGYSMQNATQNIVDAFLTRDGLDIKDVENYGLLKITPAGNKFLKKPVSFKIVEDTDFDESEEDEAPLRGGGSCAVDPALYSMLKDLRKKMSKKLDVPPYVIFQDPSLEAMATTYPVTLEELQNIPGVGAGKAKRYGQEFCVLIKKHCEENEIERPEDLRVRTVANKSKIKVSIIQAIDRKVALDDIALSKGLEFGELLDEVEAIVYSGTRLNIDYFLEEIMDEDHMLDIYDYFKESTTDKIDDAMDELGDDYTEDEIRLVRIKFISEMAN